MSDPFHLQRFVDAQVDGRYRIAVTEPGAGRKRSHWMWVRVRADRRSRAQPTFS